MKTTQLTAILVLISTLCFAGVSPKEKQALLDFYNSTNGANWNHSWDLTQDVEEWEGVSVENNTVTAISLLFNNIDGTLPASLGDLENLRILELSFNKLSGELPATLGTQWGGAQV